MIKIENISKRFYPEKSSKSQIVEALINVSMEINRGEVIGLIGLNGAGKTTLIKILAGLYTPDTGKVEMVQTVNPPPFPPHSYFMGGAKLRTSLLSAGQGLYRALTVERLINYFGILQNKDFDFQDHEVIELVEFLGLKPYLQKKIETLSSGWRQKVLVLLAFLNDPDLILLDEPSSFLDFLGQRELFELIDKEKKKGKYIVYATHNLFDIETRCDKIALLDKGALKFFETKENLFKEYNTQSLEEIVLKLLVISNY